MANKNEVIKNAGKERRLDIVRLLAKAQGFDPQGTNQELFYWAISNKLFKVVTVLTELPDVNSVVDDNHALLLAVGTGNWDIINLLLKQPGVKPFSYKNYSYHLCSGERALYVANFFRFY